MTSFFCALSLVGSLRMGLLSTTTVVGHFEREKGVLYIEQDFAPTRLEF